MSSKTYLTAALQEKHLVPVQQCTLSIANNYDYDKRTMNEALECIIKEPSQTADSCVIWLHGLGADGHDFEGILPELGLPKTHRIRFVFPHAPMRPITINQHMVMRGWYDIYSLSSLEQEDEKGIEDSRSRVEQLLQGQIDQGIPNNRIVLAGFSQGGAIAMHVGLSYPKPIAGILGLSTYLPFIRHSNLKLQTIQKKTPVLMCHGNYDDIVPKQLGEATFNYLQEKGFSPQWHEYPMGHQVCNEEITLVGQWLTQLFCKSP